MSGFELENHNEEVSCQDTKLKCSICNKNKGVKQYVIQTDVKKIISILCSSCSNKYGL